MARLFAALLLFLTAAPLAAQPETAPRVADAEAAFEAGLTSYQSGAFAEAYRLFSRTATEFDYNERTTSALLMAGKAAYADGLFGRARTSLDALLTAYPESRYAEEATRIRQLASGSDIQIPFDLGILLPAGGEDAYLGQAVFNGIRIAVEEHNATAPRRPIRMVFRNSGGSAANAARALRELASEGVGAVIGPLYSVEAVEVAQAAEEAGVVLLAPLATDAAVSEDRTMAFQANPTFQARGRAMARYATGGLNHRRLGVVSEAGTLGEEMGRAFADEASAQGAAVVFQERIAGASAWGDLERRVGSDVLSRAQAVYLPVTGGDAAVYAADALRSLEGLRAPPRPLGNQEWEALTQSRARASRLASLFTTDFFAPPGAVDAFGERYRQLSGIGPDRLALMGYDLTGFLVRTIETGGEGTMADQIRAAPSYQGLAHRFSFAGGQVNEALFILAYRDGETILVE
ncbi:MAG: penicillin-binding protein activator [Bacteroidota bacterium]